LENRLAGSGSGSGGGGGGGGGGGSSSSSSSSSIYDVTSVWYGRKCSECDGFR